MCLHNGNASYIGKWQHLHNDGNVKEVIEFQVDVDELSVTWASGGYNRLLDWSYGGYDNFFSLVGGDEKRILRWRPSIRHPLFDDDHLVWKPYNTRNKLVLDYNADNYIVYTRTPRVLKHFQHVNPYDWCALT